MQKFKYNVNKQHSVTTHLRCLEKQGALSQWFHILNDAHWHILIQIVPHKHFHLGCSQPSRSSSYKYLMSLSKVFYLQKIYRETNADNRITWFIRDERKRKYSLFRVKRKKNRMKYLFSKSLHSITHFLWPLKFLTNLIRYFVTGVFSSVIWRQKCRPYLSSHALGNVRWQYYTVCLVLFFIVKQSVLLFF